MLAQSSYPRLADEAAEDRITVLLVEDSQTYGETMAQKLRQAGFCVEWVTDGFHAVRKMSEGSIDIVVMDLLLPYLNGTAATRQIRWAYPQVPIVGISAYSDPDSVEVFLLAGGTTFVDKREVGGDFPDLLKSLI